ncbi:MAG: DUF1028 domain-containing protein, partial [Flavobacteriaceae bacterium]|nr:DUF1028 domain-containing protein [Flavobacteriaceae bacterium]
IIPGRGGVNSQAWVCIPNTNLQNAIEQMEMGSSPTEIIDWLLLNDSCSAQNFDPEYRQYGIVDLDEFGDPRTAGWTGSMADDYKEDRQGPNYSIQGNILLDVSVINNMEDNFNNTSGTLADKLMAAMQGANFAGADSRCLAAGTSSTTAYLLVYKADDEPGSPYLRLNVGQQASGTEPIDLLQDLYDSFLSTEDNKIKERLSLFPNPASDIIQLQMETSIQLLRYDIMDITGKVISSKFVENTESSNLQISVATYPTGVYFLKVYTSEGETSLKFVKN